MTLVRLILRRMRQRAFVLLGPTPDRTRGRSRRRADISEIGRPRHRRLDPVASLDVLDARSSVTLGVLPTPVPKAIVSTGMSVSTVVNGGGSAVVAIAGFGFVIPISRAVSVCARSETADKGTGN